MNGNDFSTHHNNKLVSSITSTTSSLIPIFQPFENVYTKIGTKANDQQTLDMKLRKHIKFQPKIDASIEFKSI